MKVLRERIGDLDNNIELSEETLEKLQARVADLHRNIGEMKRERASLLEAVPQGYGGETDDWLSP